ncbi:replication initiator protein [Mycobacteroides abscessus subsp. bolletii]|uniref:replication initiator n=1 Tax=Mycobacteroides abscessus TaxID=36809 RepID=UPI00092BEAC9|nr:replication initiator [Mycobacteroides abscessus]SIK04740.1 replication initiator protein [Mycobacteroides abscessus subsp. bolletii]
MTSTHGVCDGGGPAITLPGIPTICDPQPVIAQMLRRASSLGFEAWWRRAQSVGFCAAPIQLVGTDQYRRERVVWARCNNRRASVCLSCSDLYARDTWQLVHAGCAGGHHNMPTDIAGHPQVFATLTAPSFGPVHNATGGTCRDHRRIREFRRCPHGKPLWCNKNHNHDDNAVGQPLCADCYDYLGHVFFTWHLPELWRRFTITLRRNITKKLKAAVIEPKSVRVSFVKVAEMQVRAIPHIHALIRLDPATDTGNRDVHGPAATRGGGENRQPTHDRWEPPISATELAALIQYAARAVALDVPDPHADNDTGTSTVTVRFGAQIDTQPLLPEYAAEQDNSQARNAAAERLSPHRVAGYLAKYVTKSLQELGISARRLSGEAIADLDVTEHVRTILTTIDHLAKDARVLGIESLTGIGRWLHTLGYRGHITTKSRRYSTTLGALRARRHQWTLKQIAADGEVSQTTTRADQTTSEVHSDVCWQFDRSGHACSGDRVLVLSAAHRHIETRRIGLSEYRRIRREGG